MRKFKFPNRSKKQFFLVANLVLLTAVISALCIFLAKSSLGLKYSFFGQFVTAGGPVVWFVLMPMSIFTVQLILNGFANIRRSKLLADSPGGQVVAHIRERGVLSLMGVLSENENIASSAVKAAVSSHCDIRNSESVREFAGDVLAAESGRLLRKIEMLNILGNVSPMVGLFGTVFGMIKLFNSIVTADGSPNAGLMAGGISVALVTTFWGLLVAIPALTAHGILKNRIEKIIADAACEVDVIVTEISRQVKAAVRQNTKIQKNRVTAIDLTPKTKKVTADFS